MTTKKLSDNSTSQSHISRPQHCQGKGESPWSSYFSQAIVNVAKRARDQCSTFSNFDRNTDFY